MLSRFYFVFLKIVFFSQVRIKFIYIFGKNVIFLDTFFSLRIFPKTEKLFKIADRELTSVMTDE
jgi:hypothetical protein